MQKLVTIILELESEYSEELTEGVVRDAINAEMFEAPRSGKILSIEMQEKGKIRER